MNNLNKEGEGEKALKEILRNGTPKTMEELQKVAPDLAAQLTQEDLDRFRKLLDMDELQTSFAQHD